MHKLASEARCWEIWIKVSFWHEIYNLNYLYRIGIEYAEGYEKHIGYLANVKPTTYTDQNG